MISLSFSQSQLKFEFIEKLMIENVLTTNNNYYICTTQKHKLKRNCTKMCPPLLDSEEKNHKHVDVFSKGNLPKTVLKLTQ